MAQEGKTEDGYLRLSLMAHRWRSLRPLALAIRFGGVHTVRPGARVGRAGAQVGQGCRARSGNGGSHRALATNGPARCKRQ